MLETTQDQRTSSLRTANHSSVRFPLEFDGKVMFYPCAERRKAKQDSAQPKARESVHTNKVAISYYTLGRLNAKFNSGHSRYWRVIPEKSFSTDCTDSADWVTIRSFSIINLCNPRNRWTLLWLQPLGLHQVVRRSWQFRRRIFPANNANLRG